MALKVAHSQSYHNDIAFKISTDVNNNLDLVKFYLVEFLKDIMEKIGFMV